MLAGTHVGRADKLLNIVKGEAKLRGLNMLHKTATLDDGTIIVASVLREQGQVTIIGGGKMAPKAPRFTGCACSQAITFGIVEKVNEASRATGLRYQVLVCELKTEAKKDSEPGAEVGVFVATPNKGTDQIPYPTPGQTKEQRDAQRTWFHRMILCRTADGAIYKPGDLVPVIPLPFWPGETDGGEVPGEVWDGKDSEEFVAASVRAEGTAAAACRIRQHGLIPSVYFKNQGTWNALKTKEREEAGIDEPAPWSHEAFIIDPSEKNSIPDIINAYTAQYALIVSAVRSTGRASVVLADGQIGTDIPTALNADRASAATATSFTNAGHVYAAAPAPGGRITDVFDEYLLNENNLAVVMVSHSEKFPSVIVAVGRKWSDQASYEFPVTHETIGDEWTDGTFRDGGVVVSPPGWGPSKRLLELRYPGEDDGVKIPINDVLLENPEFEPAPPYFVALQKPTRALKFQVVDGEPPHFFAAGEEHFVGGGALLLFPAHMELVGETGFYRWVLDDYLAAAFELYEGLTNAVFIYEYNSNIFSHYLSNNEPYGSGSNLLYTNGVYNAFEVRCSIEDAAEELILNAVGYWREVGEITQPATKYLTYYATGTPGDRESLFRFANFGKQFPTMTLFPTLSESQTPDVATMDPDVPIESYFGDWVGPLPTLTVTRDCSATTKGGPFGDIEIRSRAVDVKEMHLKLNGFFWYWEVVSSVIEFSIIGSFAGQDINIISPPTPTEIAEQTIYLDIDIVERNPFKVTQRLTIGVETFDADFWFYGEETEHGEPYTIMPYIAGGDPLPFKRAKHLVENIFL